MTVVELTTVNVAAFDAEVGAITAEIEVRLWGASRQRNC